MLKEIKQMVQKRILIIWFSVLILLSLLPNAFLKETPIQFSITLLLFLGYIFLFWMPKESWKPWVYNVSITLLGTISLIKGFLVGGESFGLMFPLAVFIGFYLTGKRSIVYAVVFGLCATALLLRDDTIATQHLIPFVLTYIGCFIGARGYRIQSEAYEANKRHLQELQEAHKELQEAHHQLQDAAISTMQVAVLEERTRIARDIHDALGHSLTSLIVQLHALQYMLKDGGPPHAQEAVQNMLTVAKQSLEEIRSSVHTLVIDKHSMGLTPLRALLSQAEKHTGLKVELHAEDLDVDLPPEITVTLYRILQEALTNTLRHSDATSFRVSLVLEDNCILLSIQDNGNLTKDISLKPGFGLTGIQERVKALNGTLSYFIREPHGFQIDVSIPVRTDGHERSETDERT